MTIERPQTISSRSGVVLTTVGFWWFDEAGQLHIEVKPLPDWRYSLAVIGHEWLEAVWCRLRGVTTEQCDRFDEMCELEFDEGKRDVNIEPGFDKTCPYRFGHVLGSWWERFVITV